MNIGEYIKFYRNKKGLTQQQLADKINSDFYELDKKVSRESIAKYELGYANPNIEIISALACELDMSYEHILISKKSYNSMSDEIIGAKIKELRKMNNMTQKQLAECLSKSERMIQKYESGDVQPSIKVLKEISDKFQTDLEYMFHSSNEETVKKEKKTNLAFNLDKIMKHNKISAKKLGEMIGIQEREIMYYTQGRIEPGVEIIVSIAQALNISLEELILNDYNNKN